MDTPATESTNASLSVSEAAALFAGEPEKVPEQEQKVEKQAEPDKPDAQADLAQPEEEAPSEEAQKFTVKIDGKDVELTQEQIAEAYKNGLRQSDYTKKTMEAAEQRKAAEAEASKAREQRQQMMQGLQQNHALLVAALQEQDKIDWDALLQQDPQEFLKQKHLQERRQAALQDTVAKSRQLSAFEAQERLKSFIDTSQQEHRATLDKLPEWKDEKKAAAEKKEIADELISRGFDPDMVYGKYNRDGTPVMDANGNIVSPGLLDHRILMLARDAMLYRKTMDKAKAAAQKVSNLPQKVERPGGGETNPLDGRTAAMKRLNQSGSVRDAAAVFDRMFNQS